MPVFLEKSMSLFLERMSPEMVFLMLSIANDIEKFPIHLHLESLFKNLKTSQFYTVNQELRNAGMIFNTYIGRLFESVLQEALFSITDKYALDLDPLLRGGGVYVPSADGSVIAVRSPSCSTGIELRNMQPYYSVIECDSLFKVPFCGVNFFINVEAAWSRPKNFVYGDYGNRLIFRMEKLFRILPKDSWLVSFLLIPPDVDRQFLLKFTTNGGRVISPTSMPYGFFRETAYYLGMEVGLLPSQFNPFRYY